MRGNFVQQLARHRNQPTFALGFVDLKTEASKVVRPKVPTDPRALMAPVAGPGFGWDLRLKRRD